MTDNGQYQDDQGDLDVPEQPLQQDYDTPAAPPPEEDDDQGTLTHPATDSGLDDTEVYDEGVAGAAEIDSQHEDR